MAVAHDRRVGSYESVCAVVVTHNHLDLLRECLTALHAQTRAVDDILVVDNASDDGTAEMLSASISITGKSYRPPKTNRQSTIA